MTSSSIIRISTPELLWHGGGNEHGKPDPIYSLDYHPNELVLLTTGIDASVPPKGSVRLWKIDPVDEKQDFLIDFSDHQDVINVARFSPCGRMIASASEKQIVVYTVISPNRWEDVTEVKQVERTWLRPSLSDIFDLQWSPDSAYIAVAAISGKGEVIRIATRDSLLLPGHTSYVQGIAWDPLNKMIATESSDRSCKVHMLKYKETTMLKLAPRGHAILKMSSAYQLPTPDDGEKKDGDDGPSASIPKTQGLNLFADSNVPSFFRRLTFTPDGLLLIAPTGIHRNPLVSHQSNNGNKKNSNNPLARSFCTHVYHRGQLLGNAAPPFPFTSLIGLDEPSVAVRVCPRLFKMMHSTTVRPFLAGDYRMIFAVVTVSSVIIYDTQHPYPLMTFSGLHYAAINDAAWTGDGSILSFCSSDGYVTFVRFGKGIIGDILDTEAVPEDVKKSHPCLYNYIAQKPPSSESIMPVNDFTSSDDVQQLNVMDAQDDENDVENGVGISAAPLVDNCGACNKVAPSPSKETICRKPSPMEEFNRIHASEGLPSSCLVAQSNPENVDEKKKKRIQPTVVARLLESSSINLTHHSGLTPVISLVDDSNDFVTVLPTSAEVIPPNEPTLRDPIMDSPPPTPQPTFSEFGSAPRHTVEPPSKKKRIVPMLVSAISK